MDQSKSNNSATQEELIARRSFSLEFFVGVFTLFGIAAIAWLSVGLAGVHIFSGSRYQLDIVFDNVSGLEKGASVEIGGVPIGEVSGITLRDPEAVVTVSINNAIELREEDIASIRTKGIIGDRYVKISRGASEVVIPAGGRMPEMGESVVDIEDIIGKLVHNFTGDDKDSGE